MTELNQWLGTVLTERIRLRFAALMSLWALTSASGAMAEITTSGDISARVQTATNPYLTAGESTETASATVSFTPAILAGDDVTSFKLTGRVVHTEFAKRYDAVTNLGATAALKHRFSNKLDVVASISYDRAVVGVDDILAPIGSSPIGGGPNQLLPGDTSLNGLQQRRLFLNSDLGVHFKATSRDTIDVGGSFGSSRYPSGVNVQSYESYGLRASYARKVSDAILLGAQASWGNTDFRNGRLGDSRTYAIQGTITATLGRGLTATVAAGPSFARIKTATGIVRQTTAGGSVNLCQGNTIARTCVFASRSYQPSSLGSIRPLTNWGVSHSRRINERSSIEASTAFGTSNRLVTGGTVTNGFARADLGYSHRLSQSIKGFAGVGYSDSFRDITNRRANYQVNAGLTYVFGRSR